MASLVGSLPVGPEELGLNQSPDCGGQFFGENGCSKLGLPTSCWGTPGILGGRGSLGCQREKAKQGIMSYNSFSEAAILSRESDFSFLEVSCGRLETLSERQTVLYYVPLRALSCPNPSIPGCTS